MVKRSNKGQESQNRSNFEFFLNKVNYISKWRPWRQIFKKRVKNWLKGQSKVKNLKERSNLKEKIQNLTYFGIFDFGWPFMTSRRLFWKTDVKSVILIYNLPPFHEIRNLTLNDPKFEIWPQTKIFFTRKNSYVLLIILSYCSWNLVQSTIFN